MGREKKKKERKENPNPESYPRFILNCLNCWGFILGFTPAFSFLLMQSLGGSREGQVAGFSCPRGRHGVSRPVDGELSQSYTLSASQICVLLIIRKNADWVVFWLEVIYIYVNIYIHIYITIYVFIYINILYSIYH